jgi:NTP pyrophosphatase (non-canonical NTP hydrolase)
MTPIGLASPGSGGSPKAWAFSGVRGQTPFPVDRVSPMTSCHGLPVRDVHQFDERTSDPKIGSAEKIKETDMTLDEYQTAARQTALFSSDHRVTYPALGLASEAGEVAGKVKKVLRDHGGEFDPAQTAAIRDELGDVLWYVAVLAGDLGLSLDDIAAQNVEKLRSRMSRGTIQGNGDHR